MTDRLRDARRFAAAVAALVAAPLYVVCAFRHVCMAGHMQHPPFPLWEWVNDATWVILFVVAGVLSWRSDLRLRKSFFACLLLLLLSRLFLGSGGGVLFLMELPLLLVVFIVAVVGLFSRGRDWVAEPQEARRAHRRRVFRRWGIAVLAVVGTCVVGWLGYRIYDWAREVRSPQIVVVERDLPFERNVVLRPGEAVRLELPNGKDVAVWCEKPSGWERLISDADLDLRWGERPFKDLEGLWEERPDGSRVSAGWKSYIRQGSVSHGYGSEREYELFVDTYRVTLRTPRELDQVLPVKIVIRLTTEEEQLYGRAEIDHYLKMLASDDPEKRLQGLAKLQMEVGLGSDHAKGPGLAEAVRPLVDDRDERVRQKAAILLGSMGDEKHLLGLVTPEPQGSWRTEDGARRIGSWCGRHKVESVSKHVLTFFDSADSSLRDFALTYFLIATYPPAKPHVLKALTDSRERVRALAVDALRSYCTTVEVARHLKPLLNDPSKEVLRAALLQASWCNRMVSAEILTLLKSDDEEVRRLAAYALDCCQDPKVIDPLLEATRDKSAKVRARAAVSLGRIGASRVYDRLVELLGDESADVRMEAVNGLRWLKDTRAIPHIQKLLEKETDPSVRDMIKRTRRELGS